MFGASVIRHIRESAKRFIGANEGNIAVIFTIAAIPIISFVGAAIDYSRANSARSSMQAAMDSTALMLSKDLSSGKITAANVQTTAQTYFTALFTNKDATIAPITATYTANNGNLGNTIQISGNGTINTDFMRVLGSNFNTLGFNTASTTAWGNVKMRVALALDNTGSMSSDGKITALRNAVAGTGGLIDQLSGLAQNNGDVYISVIPFAKVVNPGASNYSASWIDWTDWLAPPTSQPANAVGSSSVQATFPPNWHAVGPGVNCPFSNGSGGFTCMSAPANGSSSVSKVPSTGTYTGYICPSVDYNSHTSYNGCWTSVAAGTGVFCSGSSSCSCPTGATGCGCSGSGSGRSCTGNLYSHNWTQPSALDTANNLNQPRVSAPVGYVSNKWTPTALTVPNGWIGPSTNPINTWTGCITDRTQNYDTTGDAPNPLVAATQFPANQYNENASSSFSGAYCDQSVSTPLEPIIPMSYAWSTLKTAVNAMQPTGGTDQSVGLAWAWQSLLQTGPIPAPAEDSNTTYNRVIILLSDGLNTEDRWPNYGNGSTQNGTTIDDRQALQCQNIKNATDSQGRPMYTIYTIQVNTSRPADPTSNVLKNCASDLSKFYMLTNSNQIATTFTTIGTALSELRVAR